MPLSCMRDGFLPLSPDELAEKIGKGQVVLEEGERGGLQLRAYANDILGYYLKRQIITETQRAAGGRLYSLWYNGWASRYRMMTYGYEPGMGADYETVRQLAIEYLEAINSIRDSKPRVITYDVCCHGTRAGKGSIPDLRTGLDALAKHFRY